MGNEGSRAASVYRRVHVSVWGDRRFRALSAGAPSARMLWFHLVTGPHTTQLPGLSHIGELALAEQLGWEIDAFRSCWREVEAQKVAEADWAVRVVWLPDNVQGNAPDNPSVVKGWARAWVAIPDCSLKDRARTVLRSHMVARDATKARETTKATKRRRSDALESFVAAFDEPCPRSEPTDTSSETWRETCQDTSPETCPTQEQEQDQDKQQQASSLRDDARAPARGPAHPTTAADEEREQREREKRAGQLEAMRRRFATGARAVPPTPLERLSSALSQALQIELLPVRRDSQRLADAADAAVRSLGFEGALEVCLCVGRDAQARGDPPQTMGMFTQFLEGCAQPQPAHASMPGAKP